MADGPLDALLGNETIRTIVIWGVLMQLVQPILQPIVQAIQNETWNKLPDRPLGPADAVDAALRGHLSEKDAKDAAAESGVPGSDFDTLLANAGEPPALDFLLEAFRRAFITKSDTGPQATSLEQGIRESRLHNKWIDIIEKMQFHLPDPGTVIEGWLRAQASEVDARKWLLENGISDEIATLMYKAAGRPPSPEELGLMWHRGLIPRDGTGGDTLSVQQGFLETDLKNKWWLPWVTLQTYWPPPRTVTAMVREGALPDDEGLELFKGAGLSDKLAGQYLAAAHHQKVAPEKELAKGEILKLYANKLIDRAGALKLLAALGYQGAVADWLLQIQDFLALNTKIQAAVGKLKGLFIARKIDAGTASNALKALHAPPEHVDELLQVWALEREATVHTLTAAQWASAAFYGVVSEAVAIEQIEGLGWPAFDAWVLVALRFKDGQATAQPGPPPPPPTASGA